MKIELKEITEFPAEFDLQRDKLDFDFKVQGFEYCEDVQATVTVHKTDSEYFVAGTCSASVSADCARCLEPTKVKLKGELSLIASPSVAEARSKYGDDETIVGFGIEGTLELSETVRQSLALVAPLKALCQENCRGLCPSCGINRNQKTCDCPNDPTDNRWDALRNISEEN